MRDSEKKLIEALREFVRHERRMYVPEDKPPSVSLIDAIWLLAALACLLLFFAFIPRTWLSNNTVQFALDKIAPWVLNLGAFAAFVRSPDKVIEVTRHPLFRWITAPLLIALALASIPAFTVTQDFQDASLPYIDGNPPKAGVFRVNFQPHSVELRSQPNGTVTRRLSIGFRPLFDAALHGHFRLSENWRSLYSVHIFVADETDLMVCYVPLDFEVDSPFVEGEDVEALAFHSRSAQALEYSFKVQQRSDMKVSLPVGNYDIAGYRASDHALTPILNAIVGPNGYPDYTLRKAQSVTARVSSCAALVSVIKSAK